MKNDVQSDILKDFIKNKKRILITTHLNPDADGIGSELALAAFLQQQHIETVLLNSDPLPAFFTFLDTRQEIEQFQPERDNERIRSCDGVIIVDVSEKKRLGDIAEAIPETMPLAVIDHHLVTEPVSEFMIIDENASSTGELIYELLNQYDVQWTREIIDALYACILTDTGSFRFSNTTAKTHRITAALLDHGARFQLVYSSIYESHSKHRAWLMGELLASMKFEADDKLAWFVLSQDVLQKTNAKLWEAEGLSDLPRSIKSVQISVMFTETKDGCAKASFRSRGLVPVNDLAAQFGGGGHKFAAGAHLDQPLDAAIKQVVDACRARLSQFNA